MYKKYNIKGIISKVYFYYKTMYENITWKVYLIFKILQFGLNLRFLR